MIAPAPGLAKGGEQGSGLRRQWRLQIDLHLHRQALLEQTQGLLQTLATRNPHPESVPVNALVPVEGTPLEDRPPVPGIEMARVIATARIAMPRARVRLSAGRTAMSNEAQALCFLAGANSIFAGDKLLTTPNPGEDRDTALLEQLGMTSAAV